MGSSRIDLGPGEANLRVDIVGRLVGWFILCANIK